MSRAGTSKQQQDERRQHNAECQEGTAEHGHGIAPGEKVCDRMEEPLDVSLSYTRAVWQALPESLFAMVETPLAALMRKRKRSAATIARSGVNRVNR